ncbi:hypothetical protein [Wenyingzhuangia sp. 2_MG-2023]|uniref:hypothetical protein n=1 Tax=Wenyingzhuangia sp. 2_MG-2023 TaxID=3062639 RepID=UPI0026E21CBF|nr:hypothetical protein [Wenyingzhuangia sp. 2_MG-2023]MDO6737111.1 hypothetical protein [Wenyingzhuangia sp. 2_MG-2023]
MEVRNTFVGGKMDLDSDERLIPKGFFREAQNIDILNNSEGNVGAIRKIKSNKLILSLELSNAKTIGSYGDSSNENLYFFIHSDSKDLVVEYNTDSDSHTVLLESNTTTGVLNFSTNFLITGIVKIYNEDSKKDLLVWTDNNNPIRIINISRSKTYTVDGFTEDDISLIKKPPLRAPNIGYSFESNTSLESLQDKFIAFAYRYKYIDGEYSALSSFSYYAFEPKDLKIDYSTFENKGMVNAFNAYTVSMNTGSHNVTDIELVYKESGSNAVYLIESFNKDNLNLSDNIEDGFSFKFSNNKLYRQLAEDELFRRFDNVPNKAECVEYIGNRLVFSNYEEGFDLVDSNNNSIDVDFRVELESNETFEEDIPFTLNTTKSISIDLQNQDLSKGKVISILFDLKSEDDDYFGKYKTQIDFSLNTDYDSVSDLTSSDEFVSFITEVLTNSFSNTENSIPPDNYTTKEVTSFSFTYSSPDIIIITIPKIKYTTITTTITVETTVVTNTTVTIDGGEPSTTTESDTDTIVSDSTDNVTIIDSTETTTVVSDPVTTTNEASETVVTVIETITTVVTTVGAPTITSIEYDDWVWSDSENVFVKISNSGANRSVKTNRDYELGIIYLDEYNRSSSVLTCENNGISVAQYLSDFQNRFKVKIYNKAPADAVRYKFAIKQNRYTYYNIFGLNFYVDKEYVWVKLEGSDKDKVKTGDTLFVKSDTSGIIGKTTEVRVLEVTVQEENFITGNAFDEETGAVVVGGDNEIIEPAGTYMKIKPSGFNMVYNSNTFDEEEEHIASHSGYPTVTIAPIRNNLALKINNNAYIRIRIQSHTERTGRYIDYETEHVSNNSYDNFRDFYANEIGFRDLYIPEEDRGDQTTESQKYIKVYDEGTGVRFETGLDGGGNKRRTTDITVTVFFRNPENDTADIIFESKPVDANINVFFETSEVFDIVNGLHTGNVNNQTTSTPSEVLLGWFNCYVMGNGIESISYLDAFNENYLNIDLRPTTTTIEEFSKKRRFADLTNSEPYNESSNYNGLNEFNLYRINYKDDIDKKYGPVHKLIARDTNLIIFQEDKVSYVLIKKSIVTNADGTTSLTTTDSFFGNQISYKGEFGIGSQPESIAFNDFHIYWIDSKRGAALRLSNSGIDKITTGVKGYFREKLKSYKGRIFGAYDQENDLYFVTLGNQNLSYSPIIKGWTSFHSFIPENMIGVNSLFFSFKNGDLYRHNVNNIGFGEFYGIQYKSFVKTVFNEANNQDKIYKTITTESSSPWETILKTNLSNSTITKNEYNKRESRWFAYTRKSEDSSSLEGSTHGTGIIQDINGLEVEFKLLNDMISIGDKLYQVYNNITDEIGIIDSIQDNKITVSAFINAPNFDAFCFGKKDSRIEGAAMRGYVLEVTLEDDSEDQNELFAVSCNVVKSYL